MSRQSESNLEHEAHENLLMSDDEHAAADSTVTLLRQMDTEAKKSRLRKAFENVTQPGRFVSKVISYIRHHPFKAIGIYGASAAAGTAAAYGGAVVVGQTINYQNVLATGVVTLPNFVLVIAAAKLGFYAIERGLDAAAGERFVSGHRTVKGTGFWVGGLLAAGMTLTGNMTGTKMFDTLTTPFRAPDEFFMAAPDKILKTVLPGTEGTVIDPWLTYVDKAACAARYAHNDTSFGLKCRDYLYKKDSDEAVRVEKSANPEQGRWGPDYFKLLGKYDPFSPKPRMQ